MKIVKGQHSLNENVRDRAKTYQRTELFDTHCSVRKGIRVISCRRFFFIDLYFVDDVLFMMDISRLNRERNVLFYVSRVSPARDILANHVDDSDSEAYIACDDLLSISYTVIHETYLSNSEVKPGNP